MEEETIRFPVSATYKSTGEVIYHYEDVPVRIFLEWLKDCAERAQLYEDYRSNINHSKEGNQI